VVNGQSGPGVLTVVHVWAGREHDIHGTEETVERNLIALKLLSYLPTAYLLTLFPEPRLEWCLTEGFVTSPCGVLQMHPTMFCSKAQGTSYTCKLSGGLSAQAEFFRGAKHTQAA
jgi:hypothetical protein